MHAQLLRLFVTEVVDLCCGDVWLRCNTYLLLVTESLATMKNVHNSTRLC